jgi:hypothetical protein
MSWCRHLGLLEIGAGWGGAAGPTTIGRARAQLARIVRPTHAIVKSIVRARVWATEFLWLGAWRRSREPCRKYTPAQRRDHHFLPLHGLSRPAGIPKSRPASGIRTSHSSGVVGSAIALRCLADDRDELPVLPVRGRHWDALLRVPAPVHGALRLPGPPATEAEVLSGDPVDRRRRRAARAGAARRLPAGSAGPWRRES